MQRPVIVSSHTQTNAGSNTLPVLPSLPGNSSSSLPGNSSSSLPSNSPLPLSSNSPLPTTDGRPTTMQKNYNASASPEKVKPRNVIAPMTALRQGIQRLPPIGVVYDDDCPKVENLVRIATVIDESSLLHAVANCLFTNYRAGSTPNGTAVKQSAWVRTYRNDLAKYLDKPMPSAAIAENTNEPTTLTYYDGLIGKQVGTYTHVNSRPSLEQMRAFLLSNEPLTLFYLEYICNFLNINVYLVDLRQLDVDDFVFCSKDCDANIIIGMLGNHFEAMAVVKHDNTYNTCLKADNPVITLLAKQLYYKVQTQQ